MFHFPLDFHRPMPEAILSELMSAITNKLKFVVCSSNVFVSPYDVLSGPETLLVAYNYRYPAPTDVKMLSEILNKRWQTLDVTSMMSELQRSSLVFMVEEDTLSSVHRFKRKEGASLS